jgi:hypothetical protein
MTAAAGAADEHAGASIWRAWVAGRCPCCGGCLEPSINGVECLTLGELVKMCGRCVENEHGRESDRFVPVLLECIATRSDEPLDRLLDEVGKEESSCANY